MPRINCSLAVVNTGLGEHKACTGGTVQCRNSPEDYWWVDGPFLDPNLVDQCTMMQSCNRAIV